MQLRYFLYIGYIYAIVACNLLDNNDSKQDDPKPKKKMTYSYACLDSTLSGNKAAEAISKTTSVIRKLAVKDEEVTDSLQSQYGDAFHADAIETKAFKLLDDKAVTAQLQKVLQDLLAVREAPSGIRYSIFLLESDEINAFTFGGRIYVTKAMYEKCKDNLSLLYSIIGHEIGHSEKGHIKKTIQEMMIAENIFGSDRGTDAFQVLKLLTGSFNQKNELEADYYGTDLAYQLNYDVCAAVNFWQEMSKKENQYSRFEDFFRTHPFSTLRQQCLKDHILSNFGQACNR